MPANPANSSGKEYLIIFLYSLISKAQLIYINSGVSKKSVIVDDIRLAIKTYSNPYCIIITKYMLSAILTNIFISLIIENLTALFWFLKRAKGIAETTSKTIINESQTISFSEPTYPIVFAIVSVLKFIKKRNNNAVDRTEISAVL